MEVSEGAYRIIADLLFAHSGQELTASRRWRVNGALAGLFRRHGVTNLDQLVCLLEGPGNRRLEVEVVEALLNNETYFFRDHITFAQIPEFVLPALRRARARDRRLRIWSAGCSTGQEAYSLAIQFAEQAGLWEGWDIEILGTDVSQKAIEAARMGVFSQFEVQRGLKVAQMIRHFEETGQGWRFTGSGPARLRFACHNVLAARPGPGVFDFILCRNVLLYFPQSTRTLAYARLSEALARDGYLMLGAGETVVGRTGRFAPVEGMASLYCPARTGLRARDVLEAPSA